MKTSVDSCSLSVVADGYEREDKGAGRNPAPYTYDAHSLCLRDGAALGGGVEGLEDTERRKQ